MASSSVKPTEGRARRITQNTFFLSGSEMFSRFFTWMTILYLVRHWSRDYYGQYAIAVNWITIFATFSGMGLSALGIKEIAHQKSLSNFYLRNISMMRLIASGLFFLVLAAIGPILGYEPVLKLALVVLGLRLLFDGPAMSYTILLQAHELMAYPGLVSITSAFLRMAGIVGVVFLGGRILGVCWVWVVVGALSLVALKWMGKRRGWEIEWSKFRWSEALKILKKSIPFAAFGTFQMLYYRVDAVILKGFAGNEAVAFYDVAGRFLFLVYMVADHFSVATLPAFSAARDNSADLGRIATRALKVLMLIGIPLTVGGVLLANPLMFFLFGDKYAASGPAFALLALAILFHFSMKPSINLLAVKDPSKLTVLFLGLFVLNVAANFYAIPRWGLMGAAAVSSLCEIPALLACGWLTIRYFRNPLGGFYRGIIASLLAAAVMGAGIYLDPRLYWLALGPLVYGVGLYLLGGINPDDMASLKSILRIPA